MWKSEKKKKVSLINAGCFEELLFWHELDAAFSSSLYSVAVIMDDRRQRDSEGQGCSK